ncbi:MAG TPA: gluconate 2-dehydrogenase subunit 3 family protein [Steroidobacteraceae bacterium]|nr:gluconate 2-dehydrogenase subunit 3 family protein [Steroidobacteraceae bacterium]
MTASGQALGAGWLALNWPKISAAAMHAHESAAAPEPRLAILSAAQARDFDAIASQIVPTDDTPGAHEAGAVYFIDAALGGFHAVHREEVLGGHARFLTAFTAKYPGESFAGSPVTRQVEFLKSVETTPFFQTMRFLTVLGLLAHPKYGGNRDGVGWKLVGFEDLHAFQPPFGYYDRDYAGFVPYAKKGQA